MYGPCAIVVVDLLVCFVLCGVEIGVGLSSVSIIDPMQFHLYLFVLVIELIHL